MGKPTLTDRVAELEAQLSRLRDEVMELVPLVDRVSKLESAPVAAAPAAPVGPRHIIRDAGTPVTISCAKVGCQAKWATTRGAAIEASSVSPWRCSNHGGPGQELQAVIAEAEAILVE